MFTVVPVTVPGAGIHEDTFRLSLCILGTYNLVWKGEKERINNVLLSALRDTSRMLRYHKGGERQSPPLSYPLDRIDLERNQPYKENRCYCSGNRKKRVLSSDEEGIFS